MNYEAHSFHFGAASAIMNEIFKEINYGGQGVGNQMFYKIYIWSPFVGTRRKIVFLSIINLTKCSAKCSYGFKPFPALIGGIHKFYMFS